MSTQRAGRWALGCFEVDPLYRVDTPDVILLTCTRCGWDTELDADGSVVLADLVQRAEDHVEVCCP